MVPPPVLPSRGNPACASHPGAASRVSIDDADLEETQLADVPEQAGVATDSDNLPNVNVEGAGADHATDLGEGPMPPAAASTLEPIGSGPAPSRAGSSRAVSRSGSNSFALAARAVIRQSENERESEPDNRNSFSAIARAAMNSFSGASTKHKRPRLHKMRSTLQKGTVQAGNITAGTRIHQLKRYMTQHQVTGMHVHQMTIRNLNVNSPKLLKATKNFDIRVRFKLVVDVPHSSLLARLVHTTITITNFAVIVNIFYSSYVSPTMLNSIITVDGDSEPVERRTIRFIETVCTGVFVFELVFRIIIGTIDVKLFIVQSPNFWIDVVSTLPMFIEMIATAVAPSTAHTLSALLTFTLMMRTFRVLKLLRYYVGLPVLAHALKRCLRAVLVPLVGIAVAIVLLGSALFIVERDLTPGGEDHGFVYMYDAMRSVFWVVIALGYEGDMGKDTRGGEIVYMMAVMVGIVLTTMPITIIGEAFASAWEEKEKLEVAVRMQELLFERGLTREQLRTVFEDFDESGDGGLDWEEFKAALKTLNIQLPVKEMRNLFSLFDKDGEGTVSYKEFSEAIFPDIDWRQGELAEESSRKLVTGDVQALQGEKAQATKEASPDAATSTRPNNNRFMALQSSLRDPASKQSSDSKLLSPPPSCRSLLSSPCDNASPSNATLSESAEELSCRRCVQFAQSQPAVDGQRKAQHSDASRGMPAGYAATLNQQKVSLLRAKTRAKVMPATRLIVSRLAAERERPTELLKRGRKARLGMQLNVSQISFEVSQLMQGQIAVEAKLARIERMLETLTRGGVADADGAQHQGSTEQAQADAAE